MSVISAIHRELYTTYSSNDYVPIYRDKSAIRDAAIAIVDRMASILVEPGFRGEYERSRVPEEIHLIIWMFFPGGTTAAGCTKRICDALGIGEDFDPKDY